MPLDHHYQMGYSQDREQLQNDWFLKLLLILLYRLSLICLNLKSLKTDFLLNLSTIMQFGFERAK